MMQPLPPDDAAVGPEPAPTQQHPPLPEAIVGDDEGILEEVHLLIDEKSNDNNNDLEQGGAGNKDAAIATPGSNTISKLQQYEPERFCSRKHAFKIVLYVMIVLALIVGILGRFAPKFINSLGEPSSTTAAGGSEDGIVAAPLAEPGTGADVGAAANDPAVAAAAAEQRARDEAAKQAAAKAVEEAKKKKAEEEAAAKGHHVPGQPMGAGVKENAEQKKKEEEEAAAVAAAAAAAADAAAASAAKENDEVATTATKLLDTLAGALTTASQAIQTLEQEYGPEDGALLFNSMHFLNKDYIKNKLVLAMLGQNPSEGKPDSAHDFVVSFMGTSVTAGHDNYFNQSYPIVFGEVLQESFKAAGIALDVRNHAMGNNPLIPASFAVQSFCGPDADAVVWEFGMMMGGGAEERSANIETWLRNAIQMPKRPTIMFLDADGPRNPGKDDKQPLEAREGEPEDFSKGDLFGTQGGDLLEQYRAFAPHTQSMLEALWKLDTDPKYDFNALVSAEKPTPRPASWHPGPGGHRLRAHILGYHYLNLLNEALAEVHGAMEMDAQQSQAQAEEETKDKATSNSNLQSVLAAAKAMQDAATNNPLPTPTYCQKEYCEFPTSSAITYEPRVGVQSSLINRLVKPTKPIINPSPPTLDGASNDHWHVQLFEADHDAVSLSQSLNFGYLDMKYVLQGNKAADLLELEVVTQRENSLVLCQPPGVFGRMPEDFVPLGKEHAEVKVDGVVVSLIEDKDWYMAQEMRSSSGICFFTEEKIKPGKHSVQVRNINEEGKYITLSAMIWW